MAIVPTQQLMNMINLVLSAVNVGLTNSVKTVL